MQIVAEQAISTKLRILPKDVEELSDEELEKYVMELQANRAKPVGQRGRKPKDPSAPKQTRGSKVVTQETLEGFD